MGFNKSARYEVSGYGCDLFNEQNTIYSRKQFILPLQYDIKGVRLFLMNLYADLNYRSSRI